MICSNCKVDISVTQGYVDLIKEMKSATDFLSSHPCMGGRNTFDLNSLLWYYPEEVCKRGFCRLHDGNIDIHYNTQNYKKYKDFFDKEFKEEPEFYKKYKALARIEVPYEEHFGEPWTFDHVEYWAEQTFVMYQGNKFDFKSSIDRNNWGYYAGIETSGRSYEEMIINVAEKVKLNFGNFSMDDFLTSAEKANHEKEVCFNFLPCKENSKVKRMVHNKRYIRVEDSEINRRWVKWFSKTAYAKEHWKENCRRILAGKKDQ